MIVVERRYDDCGTDLPTYGGDIDHFMSNIPAETTVH